MKTNLPDFCVSSQAKGFAEFLKVYKTYFNLPLIGDDKYYGVLNKIALVDDKAWATNIITPQEAIAILTEKQLTEGESDLVSDSEREAEIAKFKAYPYDPMSGNIEDEIDHAKRNIYKRGFKDGFEKANSVSHQQTAHLQYQLKQAKGLLVESQKQIMEIGHMNNINLSDSINQFLTHNK